MSAAAPPFAGLDDLIDGAARERGLLPPVAPPPMAPPAPSPPTPPPTPPAPGGLGQQPRDPLDDLIDGASAERAHAAAVYGDPGGPGRGFTVPGAGVPSSAPRATIEDLRGSAAGATPDRSAEIAARGGTLLRMGAGVTAGAHAALGKAEAQWRDIVGNALPALRAVAGGASPLEAATQDYVSPARPQDSKLAAAYRGSIGASPETMAGIGGVAAQQNPAESFVSGLVTMPVSLAEPKAIAAMLYAHALAAPVMGAAVVRGGLEAVAQRFGPGIAGAVEKELASSVNLAGFSGTQAALEGGGGKDIVKAAGAGAAAGLVFGVPGAVGALRAPGLAERAIGERINAPEAPRRGGLDATAQAPSGAERLRGSAGAVPAAGDSTPLVARDHPAEVNAAFDAAESRLAAFAPDKRLNRSEVDGVLSGTGYSAGNQSFPTARDMGASLANLRDEALRGTPRSGLSAGAGALRPSGTGSPRPIEAQNRVEPQPAPPGEQPRPVAPTPQEAGASAAGAGDVAAVGRGRVQGSPPGSTVAQERVNASENAQTGPLHERVRQEPRGDEGQVPAPEGRPGVPEAGGAEGGVREPGEAEEAVAPPPPIPPSPALRAMLLPPLRELARAHGLDDAGGKGAVVDRLIAERGKAARAKATESSGVQPPADRGAAGAGPVPAEQAQEVKAGESQPREAEESAQHRASPESRNDTLPAQGAPREAGTAAQRNGPDRERVGGAGARAPAPEGRGGEPRRPAKPVVKPPRPGPPKPLDKGTRAPRPGEFSRPDLERRLRAATEGVPSPDSQAFADLEDQQGEGEHTIAGGSPFRYKPVKGRMPGELRDALEGEPVGVRSLFKAAAGAEGRGGKAEDAGFEEWMGRVGIDAIMQEARRRAGGKAGQTRNALDLIDSGAPVGPEAHFLRYLHALLPEKAAERTAFGVLDSPHELPDGTGLEIGGRPFAVVHEGEQRLLVEQVPDLDPDAEIGRGEILAVDLRHLDRLPVDRGTLKRGATADTNADTTPAHPAAEPATPKPVGTEQIGQREGVFGQRVVDANTGAQRGMFGDTAPQAPEQIVRQPGESERDYKARVANLTSPDPTQMGMFPKAASRDPGSTYGEPGEAMGAASRRSPSVLAAATGNTAPLRAFFHAAAGRTLPKLLARSKDAANTLARYANARIYGEAEARSLDARVRGSGPAPDGSPLYRSDAFDHQLGTALAEGQLRGLRADLTAAGNAADAARVRTLIGGKDSAFGTEAEYRAFLASPEGKSAIERHKALVQPLAEQSHERLGGKLRSPDPATGAFINMQAVTGDESPIRAGSSAGTLTEPLKKSSRFVKGFTGTAQVYETRYSKLLARMVKGNLAENLKRDAYDALVKSGLAVETPAGAAMPTLGDRPPVRIQVERKGIPRFGPGGELAGARTHIKDLWVDARIAGEVRNALNVDVDAGQPWFVKALNTAQLTAPTDAVSHSANWLMALGGQPRGRALLADLARSIPGVNVLDATAHLVAAVHDIAADTPQVRAELAEVAKIGAGREGVSEPRTPVGQALAKYSPLRRLGAAVHAGDAAARLVLSRIYDAAAENGLTTADEAAKRDFINQVGQYNPRLMGKGQRLARSTGLAPFIVAGRNFNRVALRRLFQRPSFEAADGAARARMIGTTLAGTAASLAIPALLNFLRTGKAFPAGVPIGAVYGGKEKDGTVWYVDPLKWTGLRRGLGLLGVNETVRTLREGRGVGTALLAGASESAGRFLHPWVGPALDAGGIALTGRDLTSGRQEAKELYGRGGRGAQLGENVKAALFNVNPVLSSWYESGAHAGKGEAPGVGDRAWDYLKGLGRAVGIGEQHPRKVR